MEAIIARNWRDLIQPNPVQSDVETETPSYGKFVIEPLERGYGVTLGNALRRVLLSSIQGAAITAARINGVLHEFSTIPGVVEDVTDIVLNLKEVRVRMDVEGPKNLRLVVSGAQVVRAGDIETPEGIRILNPEHPIATLNQEGKLEMEIRVNTGRGFVTAERNKEQEMPVDMILLDANFSPIRRVNYTVTHARVGQITDYDKLVFEIWTDATGSVTPRNALAYAAKILKEQLAVFIDFDEQSEISFRPSSEEGGDLNENLLRSIEELDLSVRSYNCLKNAGVKTLADLVQRTESEMLRTKNFGRKSLNEIKEILSGMGLSLGMKLGERFLGQTQIPLEEASEETLALGALKEDEGEHETS
jgi:DNA-directed RNA polymerase subunit alpha